MIYTQKMEDGGEKRGIAYKIESNN